MSVKPDRAAKQALGVCPMCGQRLVDEQAAEHVAEYEKRTETRLLRRLGPQAMAAAEGKYAKRLAEATNEADDLRRKLEAKTARALGVEQQDALIERLARAFPEDNIVPIADDGTGDILQTVRSDGRDVGRILHECKNTKSWQNSWVDKIKQDGKLRRATRLIIESRRLPRGARGYCERDGVLACQPEYAEALTHVLRMWMIATHHDGKHARDERGLWDYLNGDAFRGRLDALQQAIKQEDDALLAEERAHQRWWDARAARAGTTRNAVSGIRGDIRELADSAARRGPARARPARRRKRASTHH